jgi:hypothetical protein
MKNTFITLLFSIALIGQLRSQCVQCPGSSTTGTSASAIGANSVASGNSAFAAGFASQATYQYTTALGFYSFATQTKAVSIGSMVKATFDRAMVIGSGGEYSSGKYLINFIPRSLMIGFNSINPTLFVSESPTNVNFDRTGTVGIGNITVPLAKLHIRADDNEDASLKLEATGPGKSSIIYFTDSHSLGATLNGNFNFDAPRGKSFIFKGGNLGIGNITTTRAKLHIKADDTEDATLMLEATGVGKLSRIYFTDQHYISALTNDNFTFQTQLGKNFVFENGNIGIGMTTPVEKLEVNGNIKTSGNGYMITDKVQASGIRGLSLSGTTGTGIFVANDGKVGIGTTVPSYNLEVSGTVKATNFIGDGLGLLNVIDYRWKSDYNNSIETNGSVIIGINNYTGSKTDEIKTTGSQLDVRSTSELNRKSTNFIDSEGRRIFFVPKLDGYGYNPITSPGDAGIFWSDGQTPNGSHQNEYSGLVIAPHKDGIAKGIKIDKDGNVGIGTSIPDSKLTVKGNIHAREVKVTISAGSDFVFAEDYNLPELSTIESYIKSNKHLPEIVSAEEMIKNGVDLGEMQIKLLQKIEELTLYIINQQKEIEQLKKGN